ncbi:helix-turn-helix transcriptional regulator [Pseudarcicella hirudinis]|uniref:S24 family peptidase n=1 Tax=Pseudarcicella hirudinis TaxID=1079859 RepID=UPI0035E4F9D5
MKWKASDVNAISGIYAYAGYLQGFNEVEYLDELPKFSIIVDKYYKGIYRAFQVRGESMFDGTIQSICSGEVAVGRHISKDYWKSKFHLHQWEDYIIVHNEGIIIKRIIRHDVENGIIVCHSLNPDKDIYPDVEINLSDCLEIYNVIQTTRTRQF